MKTALRFSRRSSSDESSGASGWYGRARRKYASLTSSAVAARVMPRISKWSLERRLSWRSWISRLRASAAARRVASDAARSVLGGGGGDGVAGAAAAGGATAGGGGGAEAAGATTDGGGLGAAAAKPEPGACRVPERGELRAAGARYSTAPVQSSAKRLRSVSSAGSGVRWKTSRAVSVPSTREWTKP